MILLIGVRKNTIYFQQLSEKIMYCRQVSKKMLETGVKQDTVDRYQIRYVL
jgi:hypothetical protein